jgi:hypothetical protein
MRRALLLFLLSTACSRAPAEPTMRAGAGAGVSAGVRAGDGASDGASENDGASASASAPDSALPASSARETSRTDGGADASRTAELTLLWNDPPMFKRLTPKNAARAAEYVVPRAGKDPEDAECVVTTLGHRHGGTIDENVKRWIDQFHPVVGAPRRMNVEISGMEATFLEVAGTYTGNRMPNREGLSESVNKPAWRLIGAIVKSPTGLWFFKLLGPDLTVRVGSRPFEDMVRSARPR